MQQTLIFTIQLLNFWDLTFKIPLWLDKLWNLEFDYWNLTSFLDTSISRKDAKAGHIWNPAKAGQVWNLIIGISHWNLTSSLDTLISRKDAKAGNIWNLEFAYWNFFI